MAKRVLACALALLLCATLSGCAAFTYQNVGELLRAPALGGGYDEIQQALSDYLGGAELQYKYPKGGNTRGPLVRADLDGDGQEEAVLLYSVADLSAGQEANFVYLAVMRRDGGSWAVVQNEKGLNTEVADIEVANLLDDGSRQLIVGYAQPTLGNKTLVLYRPGGDALEEVFQREYSRYDIGDFTGAGKAGLVVISPGNKLGGITMEYVSTEDGQFITDNQAVLLNTNFTTCSNISPGITADGRHILVVDGEMNSGMNSSQLFSQIVEYSGSSAGFYTVDDAGKLLNASARRSNGLLLSRDIDGDGMVEIPVPFGVLETQTLDKRLDEVDWMDFSAAEPVARQFGVVDSERGVFFRLPDAWRGALAMEGGVHKGEWQLYNRQTQQPLIGMKLVDPGEMPPPGSRRVLGATNAYLVLAASLTPAEQEIIGMTVLT